MDRYILSKYEYINYLFVLKIGRKTSPELPTFKLNCELFSMIIHILVNSVIEFVLAF